MKVPHYFIVVDDDPMNNLICKHIIHKYNGGAEILIFTEPEKALKMIVETFDGITENPETVLFLDINMPSMNGWEFLNEFENFTKKIQQQISIYILSSSIDQSDRDKAEINSLVKGYISKPLSLDSMNEIFA